MSANGVPRRPHRSPLVDELSATDLQAINTVLQGREVSTEQLGTFARVLVTSPNGYSQGEALRHKLEVLDRPTHEALMGALLAQDPDAPAPAVEVPRFRPYSIGDLRVRPKPHYVLDELLQADSLAVLEGVDGSYKSFTAINWGLCISYGRPWLGRPATPGRVLYILGEGSSGLVKRIDAWQIACLGQREEAPNIQFIVDDMPQLWKGDADAVLAAAPGPFALVVVDTLARALLGGNENDQQDMGLLVGGADRIRQATSACVLLVHHLNRQGSSRGSSALPGAIHTRLRLDREGTSRLAVLKVEKQRDAEAAPPLALIARSVELGTRDERDRPETSLVLELSNLPESVITAITAPVERLKPTELQGLDALATAVQPLGFTAWRSATKQTDSTFKRTKDTLVRTGHVKHLPDGPYALTPKGRTILAAEGPGSGGSKQGPMDLDGPSAAEVGSGGSGGPHCLTSSGPPDPGPSCPDPDPGAGELPWR